MVLLLPPVVFEFCGLVPQLRDVGLSRQTTHLKSITTSEPIFGRRYAGKYACWAAGERGLEGLPRPLPNHLYLFHCVLVSSSVAVVAIYEMALKLFSVSAFPVSPFLPPSLSLSLLQFLLLLLFPVSVSAVAFPFTSFVPKHLTLWLWLNALIYQIGRRPRCYTPLLSPYSPSHALCPIVLTSGPHFTCLAHWRLCCPRLPSLLSLPTSHLFIARGSN